MLAFSLEAKNLDITGFSLFLFSKKCGTIWYASLANSQSDVL